jgi:allene oxide cyclase
MKMIRWAIAPAWLVGAGLAIGFLPHPAGAAEMVHLALVERAANDTVTDTRAEGDSVGDILTFANEIYDEANATVVGSNNGFCVRTVVGVAWECFWNLTLSDGQITVAGPFLDAADSVLAVTGGTGAYSGAGGSMALHARDAKGSAYDFVYDLTR